MPKKREPWKHNEEWRSHSLACWDKEWAEYKSCAEASGKSTNGWIRDWLNEGVKYDRLLEREKLADERGQGFA